VAFASSKAKNDNNIFYTDVSENFAACASPQGSSVENVTRRRVFNYLFIYFRIFATCALPEGSSLENVMGRRYLSFIGSHSFMSMPFRMPDVWWNLYIYIYYT
jgi:hypothetical protein